jgi:hypothetical protein
MLALRRLLTVHKSESPAWGKRGFLMEKRRVGTVRFMSGSTAADKGSTDNGAGLGPRPFLGPRRFTPAVFGDRLEVRARETPSDEGGYIEAG